MRFRHLYDEEDRYSGQRRHRIPRGTIAYEEVEPGFVRVGVARVRPGDSFSRSLGRLIAGGRCRMGRHRPQLEGRALYFPRVPVELVLGNPWVFADAVTARQHTPARVPVWRIASRNLNTRRLTASSAWDEATGTRRVP